MNIRLLGVFCVLQCSWTALAMETDTLVAAQPAVSPRISEISVQDLYRTLRAQSKTAHLAEFFNPTTEANKKRGEAVISFIKTELGENIALNTVSFFEIFKQLILDPTVSTDDFRRFIVKLHENDAIAGIFFLHESAAEQGNGTSEKPRSLNNFGNSCYLNASFQLALFLGKERALRDTLNNHDASPLQQLFLQLCQDNQDDATFNTALRDFETQCRTKFFGVKANERPQQDNLELLDKLLEELSKPKSSGPTEWNLIDAVADLFSIHQTEAFVKPGSSANAEDWKDLEKPSFMITLSMKSDKDEPLPQLMDDYFKPARVKCKRGSDVTNQRYAKTTKIKNTGPYLFVNLKRTDYVNDDAQRNAHNTPFPLRLDPRNCFADEQKRQQYELVGVVMHAGATAKSGHYISYIRGLENGSPAWFHCSDDQIKKIRDEEMVRIALRGHGDTWADHISLPTTFLYKAVEQDTALPEASHIAMFMAAFNKSGAVQIQEVSLDDDVVDGQMARALKDLLVKPLVQPSKVSNSALQSFYADLTRTQKAVGAVLMVFAYGIANQMAEEAKAKKEREKKRKKLRVLLDRLNKTPSMAVSLDPTEPPKA